MDVYVNTHHIRPRHLYVMPMASTYLDQVTMNKAVEWREGLTSHYAIHVRKIEMSETIVVTLQDGVWYWASDMMVVAGFVG